jgi:hypothetical protein
MYMRHILMNVIRKRESRRGKKDYLNFYGLRNNNVYFLYEDINDELTSKKKKKEEKEMRRMEWKGKAKGR